MAHISAEEISNWPWTTMASPIEASPPIPGFGELHLRTHHAFCAMHEGLFDGYDQGEVWCATLHCQPLTEPSVARNTSGAANSERFVFSGYQEN